MLWKYLTRMFRECLKNSEVDKILQVFQVHRVHLHHEYYSIYIYIYIYVQYKNDT